MITVHRSDFKRVVVPDDDPDPSYLEQDGFEDRLKAYRRGNFNYCGVRAAIELEIPAPEKGHRILQTIESPGLWGVEDDGDQEYLTEVFNDECDVLAHMLTEMGIKVLP